jgi:TRAP-type C4-dicarboxylate transport system substrate-binding protein
VVLTYLMSTKRFQTFPDTVQKAMLAAGDAAARNVCEFLDGGLKKNQAKISAAGVTLFKLNEADQARLSEASAAAQKDWASKLDQRGKPGTEILEAYRSALK